MSTKERLLALLEENRGAPLSGEALARQMGVSRTAVWKAMRELQGQGHAIEAVQNKGYTLRPESDVLSEQGVRLYLRHSLPRVVVEQTLISTNLTAKQLAAEGAPHGTLVAANHQTGGRGRRGRSFASPPEAVKVRSIMVAIYRWFWVRAVPELTVPPADRSIRAGAVLDWTITVPMRGRSSQPTPKDIVWPLRRVTRVKEAGLPEVVPPPCPLC